MSEDITNEYSDCVSEVSGSESNTGDNICKICLYPVGEKDLSFAPCKCKLKIHHKCLEKWVSKNSNRTSCEVCGSDYKMEILEKFNPLSCCIKFCNCCLKIYNCC